MKVFAMLMLRCTFVMLLSSLFQNGTLATLEKWTESYKALVNAFSSLGSITLDGLSNIPKINESLKPLLLKENKFPIEGMEELWDRRLQKPLKIAIGNCEKLEDNVKHSGLENNKKYLESLSSKIHSIAMGILKEFNTFIIEVELELIKKVDWTSENKNELRKKFSNLCELAQQKESYCNPQSLRNAYSWILGIGGSLACQPGKPEFVECLGILILNVKLNILETELQAKIAVFEEQQPHIDGDGFMEFSRNFKLEWNQIKQQQVNNSDIASKMRLNSDRKELNDLAAKAMKETVPLKVIITKKLDELVTKCHNAELDAMMDIISDIGMFDGAVYKVLVSFEQKLDNTAFSCAELKKAVEEDKQMVSTAYQVKNKITPTMK